MEAKCLDMNNCEYLSNLKKDVDSYQKCVENSLLDLSNLNIKYEKTVREISSIFDLFEHINLITDYSNLYAIINDMLIGVLGVTGSTIFRVEDSALLVEASSISRKDLKDVKSIQDRLVDSGCVEGKLTIFDSFAIKEELCKARGIKSAAAIPLMKKDKCMGVIYLEHILENYFKEESKQFLSTLAIAVRLAIENAQLYSSLENVTLRDPMTGLYNGTFFEKEIRNCIDVYDKYGIPFTVAFADIDNFMKINEDYGTLCGDTVIKSIGKLLENEIRIGDIVCRLDGDKYGVIFRNTLDKSAIKARLEKVREKVSSLPIYYDHIKLEVSCSFGIASSKNNDAEFNARVVTDLAEKALDLAKEQGRNKVIVYEL